MICISVTSYSQSIRDSLNFSQTKYRTDIFRTSLEKRLNTYNLRSTLNYSLQFNKFFIGIDENYFSSLVSSSTKNIKDEQAVSIIGEYHYSPFITFGLLTQNSIYSDDRKIAINSASNLYSTLFTKITPIDQLSIIPYGGYSINKQVNEDDRGAIYGANLNLDRYNINEFLITSKLKIQNEDIAPRKNSHQIINVAIKKDIDLSLTNIISANYSNTRKDFYFNSDSLTSQLFNISNNIQSRSEKKYFLENRIFNSRFNSDIFFDLSGRISMRDIDRETKFKNLNNISISTFDTRIEEFRFELTGTTEYRSKFFFGKLRVDYSEREEKHSAKNIDDANPILYDQRSEQEKKKNNSSQYTTVSAVGNLFLTKKDNISVSLLHRKLTYNTPSEQNFDDRDELLSIARISYIRTFNHLFNFFANLEGNYNHIVYIFAERSSNNNVRRVLKFNTGGEFEGSSLYSKNTFEVSANYTSYDFTDINPNSRSFSFRQFSAKDSTSLNIIRKVYLDFTGYVKLSEQGNFNWKDFTNNPDRFLTEFYLEPMLKVKKDDLTFGVGLRVFSLQTFGYNENNFKYLQDKYSSIGPITNFILRLENVNLYFYGWYEFINNQNGLKKELANMTLSVNWNL